ncbi:lysozyme inhibitor LprI family protein [Mucilaginibacter sp. AW1-3]
MKFLLLLFLTPLFTLNCYAQVDLSPAQTKAIRQKIDAKIPAQLLKLKKYKADSATITFSLDTFRIELFCAEHLKLVSNDSEMADVEYQLAKSYDGLLNRYYKRLMMVLKADDKKVLIETQRAWIAFRDSEEKLNATIEKPAYGGGGTILFLNDAGLYLNLIKNRTIALFDYYLRASGMN